MPSAKAKKIQKQIPDQARFAHQEDKAGSSSPAAVVTQKENGSFIDGALSAAGSESPEYLHLDPCRHPASLVTCGRLLLTSNSLTPGASTGCSDFSFYSWLVLRSVLGGQLWGLPFPLAPWLMPGSWDFHWPVDLAVLSAPGVSEGWPRWIYHVAFWVQAQSGYICLIHDGWAGWVVGMWKGTYLLQAESEKQLYGLSTKTI